MTWLQYQLHEDPATYSRVEPKQASSVTVPPVRARKPQPAASHPPIARKRQMTEETITNDSWRSLQHTFRANTEARVDPRKNVSDVPGYICFVLSNAPVKEAHRAAFSKKRRKEVREVRSLGACVRCRLQKRRCSNGHPCQQCLQAANAAEGTRVMKWTECIRNTFQDVNLFKIETAREAVSRKEWLQAMSSFIRNLDPEPDPFDGCDWLATGDPEAVGFSIIHASMQLWSQTIAALPEHSAVRKGFLAAIFTQWEFSQFPWRKFEMCTYSQAAFDRVLRFRDSVLTHMIGMCDTLLAPTSFNTALKDGDRANRLFNKLLAIYVLVVATNIFPYQCPKPEEAYSASEALEGLLRHYLNYILPFTLRNSPRKFSPGSANAKSQFLDSFYDNARRRMQGLDPKTSFSQRAIIEKERQETRIRYKNWALQFRAGNLYLPVRKEVMQSLRDPYNLSQDNAGYIREASYDPEMIRQHLEKCDICVAFSLERLAILGGLTSHVIDELGDRFDELLNVTDKIWLNLIARVEGMLTKALDPSSVKYIAALEEKELQAHVETLPDDPNERIGGESLRVLAKKHLERTRPSHRKYSELVRGVPLFLAARICGHESNLPWEPSPFPNVKISQPQSMINQESSITSEPRRNSGTSEFDLASIFDIEAFQRDFGVHETPS